MKGKNKILFYRDWLEQFDQLSDEEAGKLIKHIMRYVNDLNPEAPDRITELLFQPFKAQFKRDLVKWNERSRQASEAAQKRWDTESMRNDADASKPMRNDAVKVKVKDKVKDNNIYIPEFSEFEEHCLTKEPNLNRKQLKLKYDSWVENDWKDGNNQPIKNWKSKATNIIRYIDTVSPKRFKANTADY